MNKTKTKVISVRKKQPTNRKKKKTGRFGHKHPKKEHGKRAFSKKNIKETLVEKKSFKKTIKKNGKSKK